MCSRSQGYYGTNIISFSKPYYEKVAKRFVDLYEQRSSYAAVLYALRTVPLDRHEELREYISLEFISRDYNFPTEELLNASG